MMEQIGAEMISTVGLLALLVGVVTELTKNLPGLRRIPTDLQALVEGLVFSLAMTLGESAGGITWQLLCGGVIRGILAAFVAAYGWEKLGSLAQRLLRKE